MKQKESVRVFKNELRNYRYYQKRIESLNERITLCYEQLSGVRGIDPSHAPIHGGVKNIDYEYYLRGQIEYYGEQKALLKSKVYYIDTILDRMETSLKQAIIDVYVDGKTTRSVADKLYLSHTALQKRINKAMDSALR